MKRLGVAILIFAGLGLIVFAQPSGRHGGSAGRAAVHARSTASRSARYARSRRLSRPARYTRARLSLSRRGVHSRLANSSHARSPHHGERRYRRPYVSPYALAAPYVLSGYGYLPGSLDDSSYGDSSASQTVARNDYPQPPAQPASTQPAYQPPTPATHISSSSQDDGAVTLVFRDGRAPLQIHNYVLTRTTLFVQGLGHREIALDQLDMAATIKTNREAGIDFSLPEGPE